jgi:hypothetical protein
MQLLLHQAREPASLAGKTFQENSMKNAHLRLAQVEYLAVSKNWSTRVKTYCDRLATDDDGGLTHMLSLFGNDSEMAAISGAISTGQRLTAELPDGEILKLYMGERATSYRGHLLIPGHKRPVRHMLCFSSKLMVNGGDGSVTVLHNDDTLIWASVISFLGLPAMPEWSGPGVQMLRNTEKITHITGFNCSPVTVTVTREDLLSWIGSEVKGGLLTVPEKSGPVFWPSYGLSDILTPPMVAEEEPELAA